MDVCRKVYLLSLTLLLISCADRRTAQSVVTHTSGICKATAVEGQYIVRWQDGHTSIIRRPTRNSLIQTFVEPNLDQISLVEQDQVVRLESRSVQVSETVPPNWGQDIIGAPEAWNQGVRGDGVIVAVIDSGLDSTHPQLKNQLATNDNDPINGVDDDQNGLVDDHIGWNFSPSEGPGHPDTTDKNGHGTHISGVIAAEHGFGEVLGVAPNAKILPLQFMDENGAGTIGHAILAIEYAVRRGAKVINASWGTSDCNQTLKTTIEGLQEKNVLFVTAAGNDGVDLRYGPIYPAGFKDLTLLAVGALTPSGFRAEYSNYGPLVHLVAPGSGIYSTVPTSRHASRYGFMSGTSMAAPFASGAAALLFGTFPEARSEDIRQAILNSVSFRDHLNVLTQGIVNIPGALAELSTP